MPQRIQQIQSIVAQRGIEHLVHFTRVDNLASIMQNGIIPIANTAQNQINPVINDPYRWDGHTNASCLSITRPNHHMFYRLRCDNPQTEWVVLLLRPALLWEKPCAFCCHNAADGTMSSQPLDQLQDTAALSGMFDEIPALQTRQEQRLLPYDTTDAQAEVLVFDTIEPHYIVGAAFCKQAVKADYENLLLGRNVCLNQVGGGFFASRSFVR